MLEIQAWESAGISLEWIYRNIQGQLQQYMRHKYLRLTVTLQGLPYRTLNSSDLLLAFYGLAWNIQEY